MLLHYFMGKFQAVKPVTEHTRGCVRADRAQWSQRGAGMLLRSSPLLFPHPEGRAVPSLLRLTRSLPFLAEEISVPTSLEDESRAPFKESWTKNFSNLCSLWHKPKVCLQPLSPRAWGRFPEANPALLVSRGTDRLWICLQLEWLDVFQHVLDKKKKKK